MVIQTYRIDIMVDQGEVWALRDLVGALERENQAKISERDTLYREIEALQAELTRMDKYYDLNRDLERRLRQAQEALAHGQGGSYQSGGVVREMEQTIADREAMLAERDDNLRELEGRLGELEGVLEWERKEKERVESLAGVYQSAVEEVKSQKNEQIRGLQVQIESLTSKNKELARQCSIHQTEAEHLSTKLGEQKSEKEIISLQLQRFKSASATQGKSDRQKELQLECDTLNLQVAQLEQVLGQHERDMRVLEEQVDAAEEKEVHLIEEIGDLSVKISNLQQQNEGLTAKAVKARTAAPAEHVEQQLQALAANYEKIEQDFLEARERLTQTEDYVSELEEQCQAFSEEIKERDQYAQELEQKIAELSSSLRNIKGDVPGVSKMDLIRSNNQMIEKINELQTKARNPFKRSEQGSQQVYDSSHAPSAVSGLKMRLLSLKNENQALLKKFQ